MPLLDVPRAFSTRLRAFDPLLRCVYEDRTNRYRIERKVTRGMVPNPSKYGTQSDYECARDGYMLLMRVRPNQLDERVIYTLWSSDLQRRGGADKVSDEMDAADAMREVKVRENFLDYVDQQSREYFRWGNTVRTNPTDRPHLGHDLSISAGSV